MALVRLGVPAPDEVRSAVGRSEVKSETWVPRANDRRTWRHWCDVEPSRCKWPG